MNRKKTVKKIAILVGAVALIPLLFKALVASRTVELVSKSTPDFEMVSWTSVESNSVKVSHKRAYILSKARLVIFDVSNPFHPRELGAYSLSNPVYSFSVSDNYVYISEGGAGIEIIEATNPSFPKKVGSFKTPGSISDAVFYKGYLYVADWGNSLNGISGGLRVVELKSPNSPKQVAFLETIGGHPWDLEVDKNYAYMIHKDGMLKVFDISEPQSPKAIKMGYAISPVQTLSLSGGYAFVADGKGGISIIDARSSTSVEMLGYIRLAEPIWSLSASGGYVFAATGYEGLRLIDVRKPSSPMELGFFDTPGYSKGVSLSDSDNLIYLADSAGGFYVLKLSAISYQLL